MTKERPESAESGIASGHDRDNSRSPNAEPVKPAKKKKSRSKSSDPPTNPPPSDEGVEENPKPKKKKGKKASKSQERPESTRTGSRLSQVSRVSSGKVPALELGDIKSRSASQINKSQISLNSISSKSSYGFGKEWDVSSRVLAEKLESDVEFIDPLDPKYECPVCCQVLRYPVQFEECGHRCCSSCLPELLRVAPRCPIDQAAVERDKCYVDKALQKEIDQLAVKCSSHDRGCQWKGILSELNNHDDECSYAVIECPNQCDAEFERRFVSQHLKEDCPNRAMPCDFCGNDIQQKNEITHLQECEMFPVPCPNGCKKKEIPRGELPQHMELDCPKQGIECPFAEAGCEFRCSRKEMDKHIKSQPDKHLEYVGRTLHLYKQVLDEHKEMIDVQTERLVTVEGKVESLEKLYGSQLIWKIDNYAEKMVDAKSGKKTTIYSPAFLTSRHGYKMALSACLFGDGKARAKYMSLFVCIMNGDYDSLLVWPFCHRVIFTLIDQCQDPSARRNVTYTVKPNTCKENRPFLSRPKGERNASFGAQKFVELEVIKTLDYIRDDAIYIKVNVESDNMVML